MFTVVPPTEDSDQLVSLLNLSGQTVKSLIDKPSTR